MFPFAPFVQGKFVSWVRRAVFESSVRLPAEASIRRNEDRERALSDASQGIWWRVLDVEALRNLAFWVLRARLLSDVEACLAGDAARRAGTAISGCLERLKDGARQANAGPVDRFIGGCLADAAVVLFADGLRQGPYLRTLFAVEVRHGPVFQCFFSSRSYDTLKCC